jgi:hypothetical protein
VLDSATLNDPLPRNARKFASERAMVLGMSEDDRAGRNFPEKNRSTGTHAQPRPALSDGILFTVNRRLCPVLCSSRKRCLRPFSAPLWQIPYRCIPESLLQTRLFAEKSRISPVLVVHSNRKSASWRGGRHICCHAGCAREQYRRPSRLNRYLGTLGTENRANWRQPE